MQMVASSVPRRLVLLMSMAVGTEAQQASSRVLGEMDELWTKGRKHVKVSKLYMRALLRRGPSIFVALAWSQIVMGIVYDAICLWSTFLAFLAFLNPAHPQQPMAFCPFGGIAFLAQDDQFIYRTKPNLQTLFFGVLVFGPSCPCTEDVIIQVFWLVLEASAGNEDSRGYVRISSVVCYATALHILAHFLLFRCRKLSHHAFEFLLDLVTDVVGFAWINVADEMLAQVFYVRAKTAFTYAVLSCFLTWVAMAAGTGARDCLNWPVEFEETANQFVAGSCALPTSWLVTQAVHIGLYGFFYRTSAANGPQNGSGKGDGQDVDVHLAASLFLLVYALLCSVVASRVLGGTVAAAVAAGEMHAEGGDGHGSHGSGATAATGAGREGGGPQDSSDRVLRAVEAGGPFTAALASDVEHVGSRHDNSATHHSGLSLGSLRDGASSGRPRVPDGGGDKGGADCVAVDTPSGTDIHNEEGVFGDVPQSEEQSLAEAVAAAARTRGQSLRRGTKIYLRLTAGMMVGWAYNLWGQVEFRQEELEFRFGPALGATVYALIATGLGVCIMVRGADRLDSVGVSGSGQPTGSDGAGVVNDNLGRGEGDRGWRFCCSSRARSRWDEDNSDGGEWRKAVFALHMKRMLVVVGGVSLMVGWAWEEAFDLMLEGCLGDSADVGMILAKVALAVFSTVVVLGLEIVKVKGGENRGHGGVGHNSGVGANGETRELMVPLITSVEPHHGVQ